jgi:DNA repair ATPase RecN
MENNAVILYDQPDNNLEKTFILETLGRKLADLKRTYQVIITTHEPLLVVNSDSNSIIRAENNSVAGVNKIKFDNLTMYDIGDKIAAIEKIAKLIDGSHAAIKKRNQIYGGFNL